eukprot:TRINITY_DN84953_c0_g1_i1.p1 TRINITY_DN84953_c0_g1~~TRINITY_DN84953_c0_g1_i1.p1  ORF type:complete len:275 (+),score=59.74 TRINITY_DN84953_c0_g1_i1:142-966(+)
MDRRAPPGRIDAVMQQALPSSSFVSSATSSFYEESTARLLVEDGKMRQRQLSEKSEMAVRSREHIETMVLMGRSGVGKSALTIRYIKDRFIELHDPTIEDMYNTDTTLPDGGPDVRLKIMDTAGQELYSSMRRGWLQTGAGFLFVFSLTERQTFLDLRKFLQELHEVYQDDPPPSVLVANKADYDMEEWAVSDVEVQELKASWKNCVRVIYTSAKTNRNVTDAFQSLCMAVRERTARRRREAHQRAQQRGLAQQQQEARRRCRLLQCTEACVMF